MAHYFCDKCKFWDNDRTSWFITVTSVEFVGQAWKVIMNIVINVANVWQNQFSSHQCELKAAATKSSDLKILLNVKSSEEQMKNV